MMLPEFPLYVRFWELHMKKDSYSHTSDRNEHWIPPRRTTDFQIDARTPSNWLRLSRDGLIDVPETFEESIVCRESVTLCHAPKGNHRRQFLQVPYSVLAQDVNSDEGWLPLSFYCVDENVKNYQWSNTWACGYHFPEDDINAREPNAWTKQYLPPVYFDQDLQNTKGLDGLVGKIPLILALGAFCARPGQGQFERVVLAHLFQGEQRTLWLNTPHDQKDTKYPKRCVVVTVGLPLILRRNGTEDAEAMRQMTVERRYWEDGHRGPMVTMKAEKSKTTTQDQPRSSSGRVQAAAAAPPPAPAQAGNPMPGRRPSNPMSGTTYGTQDLYLTSAYGTSPPAGFSTTQQFSSTQLPPQTTNPQQNYGYSQARVAPGYATQYGNRSSQANRPVMQYVQTPRRYGTTAQPTLQPSQSSAHRRGSQQEEQEATDKRDPGRRK